MGNIAMRLENVLTDDVLRYFCYKAAREFGDYKQGCFTNACFAQVIMKELHRDYVLDGDIVRLILIGRWWLREIDSCQY